MEHWRSFNRFVKSLWLYNAWPSYSEAPCTELWYECTQLIFDYLTDRKQIVKINSSFSSYLDIFQSVPQGSILGPPLFNLCLCYLFLFVEEADTMNYADGNTPHVCSRNVDVTLEKLKEVGKVHFEWFSNNFLNVNVDKCYLILCTDEPF